MKSDAQQKAWLKVYLRTILKYHESYEEVYDHILVAIESRPWDGVFEAAVNSIITEDFGGTNGLATMEGKCRIVVIGEVRKQYQQYFFSYFKFPRVLYLAAIFLVAGYIAINVSYNVVFFSALIWTTGILITPGLLFWGRKFKINYKLEAPQKLLKDSILARLGRQPFRFFWCYIFFYPSHNTQTLFDQQIGFSLWKYIGPPILIAMFIAATIHCISFVKLMKDEFKMSLI